MIHRWRFRALSLGDFKEPGATCIEFSPPLPPRRKIDRISRVSSSDFRNSEGEVPGYHFQVAWTSELTTLASGQRPSCRSMIFWAAKEAIARSDSRSIPAM